MKEVESIGVSNAINMLNLHHQGIEVLYFDNIKIISYYYIENLVSHTILILLLNQIQTDDNC